MATQTLNPNGTTCEREPRQYETLTRTDYKTLLDKLRQEEQERIDAVVPHDRIVARPDGSLFIADVPLGTENLPDYLRNLGIDVRDHKEGDEVVKQSADLDYDLTDHAAHQLVRRLNIPVRYGDRLLDEQPDLFAHNVNQRLTFKGGNYLVRALAPRRGTGPGLVRGFLSDHYQPDNNIDLLTAVFNKMQQMGIAGEVEVGRCSVDARRMHIELFAPAVRVDAKDFLRYRNPETDQEARWIYAGVVLRNSEVGKGAREIRPRPFADCCLNAFTFQRDSRRFRQVHRGSQLDPGFVSRKTKQKYMEYLESEFADAVGRFLSVEYLEDLIHGRLEALASQKLEHPIGAVTKYADEIGMSEQERDAVLEAFVKSGNTSALGALNAVTFVAQRQDPTRQYDLEQEAASVAERGFARFDREAVTAS